MAPTKKDKAVATRKATVKKSENKVKKVPATTEKQTVKTGEDKVKRPARGFHRFRNGMLNVTPKGGEKEM